MSDNTDHLGERNALGERYWGSFETRLRRGSVVVLGLSSSIRINWISKAMSQIYYLLAPCLVLTSPFGLLVHILRVIKYMYLKFLVCFILSYAVFRLYVEKSSIKLKGGGFKKKRAYWVNAKFIQEKKNRVLDQILEVPTARPNPEGKPKLFTVNF